MQSGKRWRSLLVLEVVGVVVVAAALYWIVTRAQAGRDPAVVTPLVGETVTPQATWTPRPPTLTPRPATVTPTSTDGMINPR